MATGQEWRTYFEGKPTPYLQKQIVKISTTLKELDPKIISEFQLIWLNNVGLVIQSILRSRGQR